MHERKITPQELQIEEMLNKHNRKQLGMMQIYPKKTTCKQKSLAKEMNDLSNLREHLEVNTIYNVILNRIRSAAVDCQKSIEIHISDFGKHLQSIKQLLENEDFKIETKQTSIVISWDL